MPEEFATALSVGEAGQSTEAQGRIEGLPREAPHQGLGDHDLTLRQSPASQDAIQFGT